MMKKTSVVFCNLILLLSLSACSTNPNKAESVETKLSNKEDVGGGQSLGLNDKGEMVVQNKVRLATYLKDLQTEVYTLEAQIYGDQSVGRSGLYGVLRDCKDESRSKKYGGDSKVTPPPAKDIKTKGEDLSISAIIEKVTPGKMGKNENKQLVGVSEEYLSDRIKRFEGYKSSYQERQVWFDEEVRKCQTDLKDKKEAYAAQAGKKAESVPAKTDGDQN